MEKNSSRAISFCALFVACLAGWSGDAKSGGYFIVNAELVDCSGQLLPGAVPASADQLLMTVKRPDHQFDTLSLVRTVDREVAFDSSSEISLWIVGQDREPVRLADSAVIGKLSPSADGAVYTSRDGRLHVISLSNMSDIVPPIEEACDGAWDPRLPRIVFSERRVSTSNPGDWGRAIVALDLRSQERRDLTDGAYDDTRPEFSPAGNWVLFVSGMRTGLASFWRVREDGSDIRQMTNIGKRLVDDAFVPTPYETTSWTPDGKYMAYDFKSGDREEVWVLETTPSGELLEARKVGSGLSPQWCEDGVLGYRQRTADGYVIRRISIQ